MKTLAVDFDGVIHKHDGNFGDGVPKFAPMEDAQYALEHLMKAGYKVVIFSTRLSPHWGETDQKKQQYVMGQWLEDNGFVEGVHYAAMTGCKIPAIAYIDDRGVRFTNWKDIINYFI